MFPTFPAPVFEILPGAKEGFLHTAEGQALAQQRACSSGIRWIRDYRFLEMVTRCHEVLLLVEKRSLLLAQEK